MSGVTDEIKFYLEKTLSQNPSDVAHLLKYFYHANIRFDGKYWYHFKDHHWVCSEEDQSPLIALIKNEVVNKYLLLANAYNQEVMKLTVMLDGLKNSDPAKMEQYYPLVISDLMYKSQQCSELGLKLTSHTFYQKVNSIAQELFTEKNFPLMLDTNPDLLGFQNGNLNLVTGQLDIPKNNDLVYMSVGYDYQGEGVAGQKEVENFFKDLGLVKMLPILASMISGKIRQPVIWVKDLNEASLKAIEKLLYWSFGDYLGTLPFSTLRKRKIPHYQNHTHTNLVQNCRKRLVMVEQSEGDFASVYPPMIDTLLSEDTLDLRNPYETSNSYVPQFGLIVLSTKEDTDPLEGSMIYEATPLEKEKIKIKEEWKYGMIQTLLNYYRASHV